jgi:hypothetical protein
VNGVGKGDVATEWVKESGGGTQVPKTDVTNVDGDLQVAARHTKKN